MKRVHIQTLSGVHGRIRSPGVLNFAHIEKTAGTTLRFLLEDHFDHREVFPGYFDWSLDGNHPGPQHRLLRSHSPRILRSVGEYPVGVDQITVLRDPVARMASQYLHWIRECNNSELISNALSRKKISQDFAHYLQSAPTPKFTKHVANFFPRDYQTRWLASAHFSEALDPWSEGPPPIEAAKQFLGTCRWIGLVENMREALLALHLEFAWRPTNLDRRENERNPGQGTELSEECQNILRAEHAGDTELHARVAQNAAERVSNALKKKSRAFNSWTFAGAWRHYNRLPAVAGSREKENELFEACERAYLLDRITSERWIYSTRVAHAAAALVGDGWQRREYTEGTMPYRWSGPGPVSDVDVPMIAPSGGILRIHVNAWQTPNPLRLRAFANGLATSEPLIAPSSEGGVVWTATFPPIDPALGFIRFTLQVPTVARLCDFTDTSDRREVGFSFKRLTVSAYQ